MNLYRYVGNRVRVGRDPWGMSETGTYATLGNTALKATPVTARPELVVIRGGSYAAQAVTKVPMFDLAKGIITRLLLAAISISFYDDAGFAYTVTITIDANGFLVVHVQIKASFKSAEVIAERECETRTLKVKNRPTFSDPNITKEFMEDARLFPPGDNALPGGTAGALLWEACVGKPYKGSWHYEKAVGAIRQIDKKLASGGLSDGDRKILEDLSDDLESARDYWDRFRSRP